MDRRTFLATTGVTTVAATLSTCPKSKDGKPINVSDIVKAARAFAIATVALGATDEIAEILTSDQTLSTASARDLYGLSERVLRILDRVRDSINAATGWDSKQVDELLDQALAEVAKFEAEIGIKNPQSAARFRQFIALLRFGIASAAQIVKNLKPPTAPATPLIDADAKRQVVESITADQLTLIMNVSIAAARKLSTIYVADAELAWKMAAEESKAIHAANVRRLQNRAVDKLR